MQDTDKTPHAAVRINLSSAGAGPLSISSFLGVILSGKVAGLSDITDIQLSSGEPVMVRRASCDWIGVQTPAAQPYVFADSQIKAFINGVYTGDEQKSSASAWEAALRRSGSLHPAVVLAGEHEGQRFSTRVRCTLQRQQMGTALGLMIRVLAQSVRAPTALGLPPSVEVVARTMQSGLVVVTGPTGSGKSTTLASLLQSLARVRRMHLLTIEDPVEYEFERGLGPVTQREIGVDVPDFTQGVRDALRFVPDAILVGETRDAETMRAVVRAAESGHIVMTSMHTPTATGAIAKMRALLADNPADLSALASSLRMVIAQTLVRDLSGANVLVYEVLNCSEREVQSAVLGDMTVSDLRQRFLQRGIKGSIIRADRLSELVSKGSLSRERMQALLLPDERGDSSFR